MQVGKFAGWVRQDGQARDKVHETLAALALIEEGILTEANFVGLSTTQAAAVTRVAGKVKRSNEEAAKTHRSYAEQASKDIAQATNEKDLAMARLREKAAQKQERKLLDRSRKEAIIVGEGVSKSLQSGEIGYREAAVLAAKIKPSRNDEKLPYIEDFAKQLAKELNRILDEEDDRRAGKLRMIIESREALNVYVRNNLVDVLLKLSERASLYAKQLSPVSTEGRALITQFSISENGGKI